MIRVYVVRDDLLLAAPDTSEEAYQLSQALPENRSEWILLPSGAVVEDLRPSASVRVTNELGRSSLRTFGESRQVYDW